ncbi:MULTISPECIES: CDP-glycerol glycerophosphotransferase family protein [Halorussus]|uniref:CDP-glycerol glycerophosphotransferase family protein n=1 Tax=Halorussus TaxID=1070314 RepID=UPI000E20E010|nr:MULTISPECIES: CDP-glycerol glycerophosphotransferase family protein [Halorussus]NHN59347.1 glycosyl/glycerophosphate transferase [Halorussus sp. JP-T4]
MDLTGRVAEPTERASAAVRALAAAASEGSSLAGHGSFLAQWGLFRGVAAADSVRDRVSGIDPAAVPFDRDSSLWVFGARGGSAFADNAKYLFLHVAADHPEIRPVWLSKDPDVVRTLQAAGFEAYRSCSPRGLLLTLRAGAVFLTQGHRDLAMPATAGAFTVLLWHGVPLKRISWDAGFRDLPAAVRAGHADMAGEFDLLTVPGAGVADAFASGLRIDRHRMVLAGYPRNDALFGPIPGEGIGLDGGALARIRALATDQSLVFYLPTFREWTDESPADRLDFDALDAFLAERAATLVVKTHPRDTVALPDGLRQVVQLPEGADVYPFLRHADALVTDYSSIYFDYLLLDRPVVFHAYDLDEYRARRGFYFDYESVAPGPVARTFDGLLAGLDRALDPTDDPDADRRAAVRERLLGADPATVGGTKSPEGKATTDSGRSTGCAPPTSRSAAVARLVRRRLAVRNAESR